MIKTPKKWLYDIVGYGAKIQEYLADLPDFISYSTDEKTKLAVERCSVLLQNRDITAQLLGHLPAAVVNKGCLPSQSFGNFTRRLKSPGVYAKTSK
jgi:hypothetical protein